MYNVLNLYMFFQQMLFSSSHLRYEFELKQKKKENKKPTLNRAQQTFSLDRSRRDYWRK